MQPSKTSKRMVLLFMPWISIWGCTSQRADFIKSECHRVKDKDRLQALAFNSEFRVDGFKGEQLIYKVRLFDRNRKPIRSWNGRYETKDGTVAASKAFWVKSNSVIFNNVQATIPAKELGIREEHIPVIAEIGLYRITGECVAAYSCRVPIYQVAKKTPVAPKKQIDKRAYWFVKSSNLNRLPVLLGPYRSSQEALGDVTEATEAPQMIHVNDYLWFVPFWNTRNLAQIKWIGPFRSQSDALEITAIKPQAIKLSKDRSIAGKPISMQLKTWLAELANHDSTDIYPQ